MSRKESKVAWDEVTPFRGVWGEEQEIWLTRQELAARWKMPVATLAQWASQGRGPQYSRFGRHARYRLSWVIAWENEQSGGAA